MADECALTYILTRILDGVPVYWTGSRHFTGDPQWTLWKGGAFHFSSPRAAYEAAATHPEINQAEWRVIAAAAEMREAENG